MHLAPVGPHLVLIVIDGTSVTGNCTDRSLQPPDLPLAIDDSVTKVERRSLEVTQNCILPSNRRGCCSEDLHTSRTDSKNAWR